MMLPIDGCPPNEAILAFARGQVDEMEIVPLANHFEACQSCAALLDTVDSGLDAQTVEHVATFNRYQECRKTHIERRVGRYEIVSLIAKGGMSRVYRAFHPVLKKVVALKTLSTEVSTSPQFRDAIVKEQALLGQLSHPNIVTVYDAGFDGDMPFIVMELVEGESLARLVARKGSLEQSVAIDFALAIAVALQKIHSHGLVHRDIKPSNVMVDKSGCLKLLDLGLAIPIGQFNASESQRRVGTPGYIPREQQNGAGVDHRSDIYGLGATIFTMLLGRLPKDESDISLSTTQLAKPMRDLLARMLQEEKDDRPESMDEVVQTLGAVSKTAALNSAWPAIHLYAFWGAVAILVLASGAWYSLTGGDRRLREAGESVFVASELTHARGLIRDSEFVDTAIARPTTLYCSPSLSGEHIATLGFDGSLRIYELSDTGCRLSQLVPLFSSTDVEKPQLTWLDADSAIACSGPTGEPLRIWDIRDQRVRRDVPYEVEIRSSYWEPAIETLAVGDQSGRLCFYDALGSETDSCRVGDASIEAVCSSGSTIFLGTSTGELLGYSNGKLQSLLKSSDALTALDWNDVEQTLTVGTDAGVVSIWRAGELAPIFEADSPVNSIASSPDGSELAIASYDVDVVGFDDNRKPSRVFSSSRNQVAQAEWIGSKLLVSAGELGVREVGPQLNGSAQLIDSTDCRIVTMAWAPDGNHLAVGTTAGGLWVVEADGEIARHIPVAPSASLGRFEWSPNGERLVGLQLWCKEPVFVWKASSKFQQFSIGDSKIYLDVAWLDDLTIATLDSSGLVSIRDVDTNKQLAEVACEDAAVCISYSRSNSLIGVGHQNGNVHFWAYEEGSLTEVDLLNALESQLAGETVRDIAWSPNGEFLAVCSRLGKFWIGSRDAQEIVFSCSLPYVSPQEISWASDSTAVCIADFGTATYSLDGVWELRPATHRHFVTSWVPGVHEFSTGDWMNAVRHHGGQHRSNWTLVLSPTGGAVTLGDDGRENYRFGSGIELVR